MTTAPASPPALVVAGVSVRALAASARRGGWRVIGLDLFGDRDTRRDCEAWRCIGDAATLAIDPDRLRAGLAFAARLPGVVGWVAGGGFDGASAWLDAAGGPLPRLGCDAAAIDLVRDPRTFFATLDHLGLRHPPVRRHQPITDPHLWLAKRSGGAGGLDVVPAEEVASGRVPLRPDTYFQRREAGTPMSALFVADGRSARLLGINRQLVRGTGARPWTWAGAIGSLPDAPPADRLADMLDALVPAFGLRGLCSLDLLDDAGRLSLLEVNPRPSASMAVHDERWPGGLVRAHLDGVAGRLPSARASHRGSAPSLRGQQVVFAREGAVVDEALSDAWLADPAIHDVPRAGLRLSPGDPVCSVSAQGDDERVVAARLAARAEAVAAALSLPCPVPHDAR